jgi:hypothetical protein
MNISNSFLKSYIGGILYFRFPRFEKSADWYYLFRSKIIDMELDPISGLWIQLDPIFPNRFSEGEWSEHRTKNEVRHFEIFQAVKNCQEITLPNFTLLSNTILRVQADKVADAVIYANEDAVPDEIRIFRDFPEGYEAVAGLGAII